MAFRDMNTMDMNPNLELNLNTTGEIRMHVTSKDTIVPSSRELSIG
jgi:hypothetical protein